MEFALTCLIAAGLSGGFVNGLAGFGTGLFALGWLLQVMPPQEAVAIVVACSVLVSLPGVCKVRRHIPFLFCAASEMFSSTRKSGLLQAVTPPTVSHFRPGMIIFLLGSLRMFHWRACDCGGGCGVLLLLLLRRRLFLIGGL